MRLTSLVVCFYGLFVAVALGAIVTAAVFGPLVLRTIDVVEGVGVVAGTLAIAGVLLNNRRRRACFYFWIASNILAACLHAHAGIVSLVIRDVVFTVLAIEGAYKWRKETP